MRSFCLVVGYLSAKTSPAMKSVKIPNIPNTKLDLVSDEATNSKARPSKRSPKDKSIKSGMFGYLK